MRLLMTILRAAHCRSTHHYMAIDALQRIETAPGKRLARLLLHHYDRYLTGAKDPDTRFRDFHNHVIHVRQGYWGGAPGKAIQWYARAAELFGKGQLGDAAHALGVLSHYVTDPMQPLHTAQSDAEKVLHRPIEWSITRSYPQLAELAGELPLEVRFDLSHRPGWLAAAILHGASVASQRYESLLDEYDLQAGKKDPPRGLNRSLQETIAELIALATTGWARILERAATEAEAQLGHTLPRVQLSVPALLATIQTPHRLWLRRIVHREEQAAVSALIDEFERTGDLQETLPAEWKTVQRSTRVYQRERARRKARQARSTPPAKTAQKTESRVVESARLAEEKIQLRVIRKPPADESVLAQQVRDAEKLEKQRRAALDRADRAIARAESNRGNRETNKADNATDVPPQRILNLPRRDCLSRSAPIVDAPSIGPKTAARFHAIGMETVGDLLDAEAESVARRLQTRWIDPELVRDWQCQTDLMTRLPRMRACDAKLLVGSGHATVTQIAAVTAKQLQAKIADFAATAEGRRALRGSQAPEHATLARWIELAGGDPARVA